MAAVDALNVNEKIPPIYCEATELLKLPPLSLDPVSAQVQDNTKPLLALTSVITDLEKRLSTFQSTRSGATDDVCPQVSKQASTYSSVVASGEQRDLSATSAYQPPVRLPAIASHRKPSSSSAPEHYDRESNLILFGLEECASLVDAKQQVDEILEFLTGKQIAIKDLFRLGHYKKKSGTPAHASRPRPVLIKLSTAWDWRIVLMTKRKLKSFRIAHLFLREDLPIGLHRPETITF